MILLFAAIGFLFVAAFLVRRFVETLHHLDEMAGSNAGAESEIREAFPQRRAA